jgi:ankyrin repeat protein
MERLLDRGVDVNYQGNFGQTPLFEAAVAGQLMAVRFLLDRGADASIVSNDGAGPLFFACARGFTEIVDLLIEHGADVNALRRTDYRAGPVFTSPLQVAISGGHTDIVKKLIRAGANLDHRVNGMSMLGYAKQQGRREVVACLSSMKIKK